MAVLSFLLVFIIASQALAFAVALIARSWVWVTEPVVLRGIDTERARTLVAVYMESVADTRFGFPTGVFRIDTQESSPTRLVARELNFQGSTALQLGRVALVIPATMLAAVSDEGFLLSFLALMFGFAVAAFVVVPMVAIGVIEILLRWLMRSRVVAVLGEVADEQDACTVTFELSGLSGFGVRRLLLSGLAAPALPPRWGGSPTAGAQESWFADRLNVVYASGSAIAAVIAAVVLATTPLGHPGSRSPVSAGAARSAGFSTAEDAGSPSTTSSTAEATGSDQASSEGTTATGATDLAANPTQGEGFTLKRPAGDWSLDHLETQKPGYIETRWHLVGAPQTIFLIDHTPGFSGTAHSGAQSVRGLFKHVSAYHEISFAAHALPAGKAWRWEYLDGDTHSVDTFLVACNTGFAIRGSAPASQWSQYAQSFEDAIATLTPDCE